MNILKDLYYGNIKPANSFSATGHEYRKACQAFEEMEKEFIETLSQQQRETYMKTIEAYNFVSGRELEEMFQYAYRLGAKLTLASLTESNTP